MLLEDRLIELKLVDRQRRTRKCDRLNSALKQRLLGLTHPSPELVTGVEPQGRIGRGFRLQQRCLLGRRQLVNDPVQQLMVDTLAAEGIAAAYRADQGKGVTGARDDCEI